MTDFEYDVMKMKRLAGQSRHKKRGSKSKKCSLGTDYMTRRDWERRNGSVVSFNLNKAMAWDEFKGMPKDLQEQYIKDLQTKFHMNAKGFGEMFGVAPGTVLKYCSDNKLGVEFVRGIRMNQQERYEFDRFLGGFYDTEDGNTPVEDEAPVNPEPEKKQQMAMTSFSLEFSGKFNPEDVYNSLSKLVPKGSDVKIKVKCEIVSGGFENE